MEWKLSAFEAMKTLFCNLLECNKLAQRMNFKLSDVKWHPLTVNKIKQEGRVEISILKPGSDEDYDRFSAAAEACVRLRTYWFFYKNRLVRFLKHLWTGLAPSLCVGSVHCWRRRTITVMSCRYNLVDIRVHGVESVTEQDYLQSNFHGQHGGSEQSVLPPYIPKMFTTAIIEL